MDILAILGAVAILLGILALAAIIHLAQGAIVALFIVGAVLLLLAYGPRINSGRRFR